MQEIEIKFRVENLDNVKEKLNNLGCIFSKELNQKDTIFLPDLNNTESKEGSLFVRIRDVNGKVELNLKKQSAISFQAKEIEFGANDFDSAYDFLDTLGLKEWVTVEKKRTTTIYNKFNICIDSVKRLGNFVEIELLTNEENKSKQFEKEILGLANKLGINTQNRINSFYDTMIYELNKQNN